MHFFQKWTILVIVLLFFSVVIGMGETRAQSGSFDANIIFGQVGSGQTSPNQIVTNRVFYPSGVVVDRGTTPNRVYIYDNGNSRILGFSSTNNANQNADIVIGQPDFNSGACNGNNNAYVQASASTLCGMNYPFAVSILESPSGVALAVDANHNLYVNDMWNHRVLKYNDPFSNDKAADFVWGQDDFSQRSCNQGRDADSPSANSICNSPISQFGGDHLGTGVDVDNAGNVWAVDGANNRILRFGPNSKTADLVIGQINFTTNDRRACGSTSPNSRFLCAPKSVRFDSRTNSLYVVDWPIPGGPFVTRILIYNGPFTNGMAPSDVIIGSVEAGHPLKLARSQGLTLDPNTPNAFWLEDSNYHRILFFQKIGGSWVPTKVIGQPNLTKLDRGGFSTCPITGGPPFMCEINAPIGGVGIDSEGNIYAGDIVQNQIMRFPPPPDVSALGGRPVAANKIYLQSQQGIPNAVTASSLNAGDALLLANYPNGAKQFLVGDSQRLLFWNNYESKASGSPADGVIFQPDFTSYDSSGKIFTLTKDSQGRIWVVKSGEPIYVFQGPLRNHQSADFIIPQVLPLRFGGTIDVHIVTGIAYDETNDALWIADAGNHRVVRLRHPLNFATREVDMVLGQPSLTSTAANRGRDQTGMACPSVTGDSFANLGTLALDNLGNLYIVDATHEGWQCSNNRIVSYDRADLIPSPNNNFFANGVKIAKRVYGKPNFTSKINDGNQNQPQTPMGMTFDGANRMIVVADAYGNQNLKRVFGFEDPLRCSNPATVPCSVQATSVIPLQGSQLAHPSFDQEGNLGILDHTWNRAYFYRQPTWLGAVTPFNPLPIVNSKVISGITLSGRSRDNPSETFTRPIDTTNPEVEITLPGSAVAAGTWDVSLSVDFNVGLPRVINYVLNYDPPLPPTPTPSPTPTPIPLSKPDLTISQVSVSPNNPLTNSTFRVTALLSNIGSGDTTNPFVVSFKFSRYINGVPTSTGSIIRQTIVPPFLSTTLTPIITNTLLSNNYEAGLYLIEACADTRPPAPIDESDETNNCQTIDRTIGTSSTSTPTTATPSASLISNPTSSPSTQIISMDILIQAADDARVRATYTMTPEDPQVNITFPGAANQARAYDVWITTNYNTGLPTSVNYRINYDPSVQLNLSPSPSFSPSPSPSSGFVSTNLPDLVCTNLNVSPAVPVNVGTPLSFNLIVQNIRSRPAFPSETLIQIFKNQARTGSADFEAVIPTNGLAGAGQASLSNIWPSGPTSPGVYYYFVDVDKDNQVPERDETNNSCSVSFTVLAAVTQSPTPTPTPTSIPTSTPTSTPIISAEPTVVPRVITGIAVSGNGPGGVIPSTALDPGNPIIDLSLPGNPSLAGTYNLFITIQYNVGLSRILNYIVNYAPQVQQSPSASPAGGCVSIPGFFTCPSSQPSQTPVASSSPSPSPLPRICAQVITPAINSQTGVCQEFPTPCAVPDGWIGVNSCPASPTPTSSPTSTTAPTPTATPTSIPTSSPSPSATLAPRQFTGARIDIQAADNISDTVTHIITPRSSTANVTLPGASNQPRTYNVLVTNSYNRGSPTVLAYIINYTPIQTPTPSPTTAPTSTPTLTPTPTPTPLPPTSGSVSGTKKVFVTSALFNGNLGGLDGADTKCQDSASAANLAGNFKAWLSSSTVSAASRLTHGTEAYQLTNGVTIAQSWDDLVDGNIASAIKVDETGTDITSSGSWNSLIWTNTNTGGQLSTGTNSCSDWTANSSFTTSLNQATIGDLTKTNSSWTTSSTQFCGTNFHLYCIEQ